jgi:hypothetical protein
MCFLPNSRASIDQAPGPIIANVALSVATMTGIQACTPRERRTQTSIKLTSVPTIGVHRPSKINIDKPAPMTSGRAADPDASLKRLTTP